MTMFDGKSILVTGGTGSFGQRFVRTVLSRYKPRRVIVYSRDELKQYEMEHQVCDPRMRYFIGDVRDRGRLGIAMKNVDVVVHAAALKQVPAAEYNPMECVKTNILGGQNVVEAAIENNVHRVIALSTDKAGNPVNLYGATKLAADKLFVAGNNLAGAGRTRFSVVRYGNVVGSRGSVINVFSRIKKSGDRVYPVTDKRMTRFWITLDQGVDFVLKCFARMQGGEIFIPRIPSIRIVDLVKAFDSEGTVSVVGMRPGEKLHEVMCPQAYSRETIEFKDHFVIVPTIKFFDDTLDYCRQPTGEQGAFVDDGFEYASDLNDHFLTVDEIRDYDQTLDL